MTAPDAGIRSGAGSGLRCSWWGRWYLRIGLSGDCWLPRRRRSDCRSKRGAAPEAFMAASEDPAGRLLGLHTRHDQSELFRVGCASAHAGVRRPGRGLSAVCPAAVGLRPWRRTTPSRAGRAVGRLRGGPLRGRCLVGGRSEVCEVESFGIKFPEVGGTKEVARQGRRGLARPGLRRLRCGEQGR